jgi:hypothetical protein
MMSPWLWLFVSSYFGNLLLALRHPIFPLIAYLTFYYMPPHWNWWGRFLPDLRYSMLAAFVLALSVVIHRNSAEPLKEEKNPALPWLLFFGLNTIVVTIWAFQQARSWFFTVAFLKLILIYVLIPPAIRLPVHFDTFAAVHIAGATFWGYKAWDNPKRSSGRLEEVGGVDTQNDNQAAGHLLTVLPFAALYVLTLKRKFPRAAAAVGAAFVANLFVLCNSRGATLGMIASGLAALALIGKGRRVRMMGIGILGIAAMLVIADPEFIQRQQTTADPQDGSAQSRLMFWQAGIEMVRDHPLGGGGRAFHILSSQYLPDLLEEQRVEERSAHNTYVQLSTEWGVQGTVLYLGFMIATLRLLHNIRRRTPENEWYFYRSLTVEVALIGTMTAAMFSNRLYGESIYWLCALAFALHRLQSTELARSADETQASESAVEAQDGDRSVRGREAFAR